jgi:hypothetical protein
MDDTPDTTAEPLADNAEDHPGPPKPDKEQEEQPTESRWSAWWKKNDPTGALILVATIGVSMAGALIFLAVFWDASVATRAATHTSPETASPKAVRALEVVKVCLQVIFVGTAAALATAGTTVWQRRRQDQAEKERVSREDQAEKERTSREDQATKDRNAREDQAQRDRIAREQQATAEWDAREDFEVRSALLDRSTRCAQDMYLACQHLWRHNRTEDAPKRYDAGRVKPPDRERLHEKYLEFSTEAQTIETLLRARYHTPEHQPIEPRVETAGGPIDSYAIPPVTYAALPVSGRDEATWRWHQVYDLSAVYYFSLLGTDRLEGVRGSNSIGHDQKFHSGLPLEGDRFGAKRQVDSDVVQATIRAEFKVALDEFAEGLLRAQPRDPGRGDADRQEPTPTSHAER